MEPFVARNNPLRLALILLGCVGFILAGCWLAGLFGTSPSPNRAWAGWAAIVFFGLVAVVVLRRLLDGGDQIVVDRNGIFWRSWSDSPIPWGAIRSIRTAAIRNQPFLCIDLHEPSAHPPRRRSPVHAMNRRMGFGDIAITVQGTDRRFAELEAAVDGHAAAAGLSMSNG